MNLINQLTKMDSVRTLAYFWLSLYKQFHLNVFTFGSNLTWFFSDLFKYGQLTPNPNLDFSWHRLFPMIKDKTAGTPIEPSYYFQDTWACGQLFSYSPKKHYDVGSQATTVGIMSQFVPTTFIDIRPIDLTLPHLTFLKGDIVHLPLADNSVESFSSLCVLEHIGLGRYGDTLDQWGTEKAAAEIKRVLKKNGHLLVSLPVDSKNRVYFNAHRAFTRQYLLDLFQGLKLVEEKYIYGRKMYDRYSASKGFGTGLYHFQKK